MYKTAIPAYKKCKNMTKDIEFQKDLVMMNNLTATEKLEYALQMAETISVLNNYENGVIVHDDVQLVQFLLAPNGKLKLVRLFLTSSHGFDAFVALLVLTAQMDNSHFATPFSLLYVSKNDFNRMEVMYFDEENQEYCRYRNNPGHGPWRAPEEYFDWPLDEKIDIWSLGNMFYSMMTGMYPFYHECSSKAVQKRVKKKETPFIDPRWRKHSFAEAALVKVIRQCWAYRPADRIDIGSMVLQLREAVEENQARHRKAKQRQKSRTRGEIETTTQAAG
jgi:serine/threonine protein kinase